MKHVCTVQSQNNAVINSEILNKIKHGIQIQ